MNDADCIILINWLVRKRTEFSEASTWHIGVLGVFFFKLQIGGRDFFVPIYFRCLLILRIDAGKGGGKKVIFCWKVFFL